MNRILFLLALCSIASACPVCGQSLEPEQPFDHLQTELREEEPAPLESDPYFTPSAWNFALKAGASLEYGGLSSGPKRASLGVDAFSLQFHALSRSILAFETTGLFLQFGLNAGAGLANVRADRPALGDPSDEEFGEFLSAGFNYGLGFYVGRFTFCLCGEFGTANATEGEEFSIYEDQNGDGNLETRQAKARYDYGWTFIHLAWGFGEIERSVDFRGTQVSLDFLFGDLLSPHETPSLIGAAGVRLRGQTESLWSESIVFVEFVAIATDSVDDDSMILTRIGLEWTF